MTINADRFKKVKYALAEYLGLTRDNPGVLLTTENLTDVLVSLVADLSYLARENEIDMESVVNAALTRLDIESLKGQGLCESCFKEPATTHCNNPEFSQFSLCASCVAAYDASKYGKGN